MAINISLTFLNKSNMYVLPADFNVTAVSEVSGMCATVVPNWLQLNETLVIADELRPGTESVIVTGAAGQGSVSDIPVLSGDDSVGAFADYPYFVDISATDIDADSVASVDYFLDGQQVGSKKNAETPCVYYFPVDQVDVRLHAVLNLKDGSKVLTMPKVLFTD